MEKPELMGYVERRVCPKCGNIMISTRYDQETKLIVRKCLRCLYSWKEHPLDAKKEERWS